MTLPFNSLIRKDERTVRDMQELLCREIRVQKDLYNKEGRSFGWAPCPYRIILDAKIAVLDECEKLVRNELNFKTFQQRRERIKGDWDAGFFSRKTLNLVTKSMKFHKEFNDYFAQNAEVPVAKDVKSARNR